MHLSVLWLVERIPWQKLSSHSLLWIQDQELTKQISEVSNKLIALCNLPRVCSSMVSINLVSLWWSLQQVSPRKYNAFRTRILSRNSACLVQGHMTAPARQILNGTKSTLHHMENSSMIGNRYHGTNKSTRHRFLLTNMFSDMRKKMVNLSDKKIQRRYIQEWRRILSDQESMK